MPRHDLRNYSCRKSSQLLSTPSRVGELYAPAHEFPVPPWRGLHQISHQRPRLLSLHWFKVLDLAAAQICLVHSLKFVEYFAVLHESKVTGPPEAATCASMNMKRQRFVWHTVHTASTSVCRCKSCPSCPVDPLRLDANRVSMIIGRPRTLKSITGPGEEASQLHLWQ
jgi:hypothetical protein